MDDFVQTNERRFEVSRPPYSMPQKLVSNSQLENSSHIQYKTYSTEIHNHSKIGSLLRDVGSGHDQISTFCHRRKLSGMHREPCTPYATPTVNSSYPRDSQLFPDREIRGNLLERVRTPKASGILISNPCMLNGSKVKSNTNLRKISGCARRDDGKKMNLEELVWNQNSCTPRSHPRNILLHHPQRPCSTSNLFYFGEESWNGSPTIDDRSKLLSKETDKTRQLVTHSSDTTVSDDFHSLLI